MTAFADSSTGGAAAGAGAPAVRLGALCLAFGAAGVVATSLFYGMSPPAAAAPVVPLDLTAAAEGAVKGAVTMHLAGLIGIFGDIAITGGGFILGVDRLMKGDGVAALGWVLIAVSTIIFAIVDALVGFVLPQVAIASGASPAFLAAKILFDILFMLGAATFGAGAVLAVARNAIAGGAVPRILAVPAVIVGLVAFVSGTGGSVFALNLSSFMGLGILGGSVIFTLIGLRLAFRPR
jgi:hypothetical protein